MEAKAPSFSDGSILGIGFWDYVRWVEASADLRHCEPLGLPPEQRTALWTPRHILGLWDSLLRGLPIGMFFLIPGGQDRRPVYAGGTGLSFTVKHHGSGYDLLDGQQRTRAMMLALRAPKDEGRCLWVDLGTASGDGDSVVPLRLTTRSQPFGYDADGVKLRLDERAKARKEFDGAVGGLAERKMAEVGTKVRRAYDHELFDLELSLSADKRPRPPRPAKATLGAVPLQELLYLWDTTRGDERCFEAQAFQLIGPEFSNAARLETLIAAFRRLDRAKIALILVQQPDAGSGKQDADWKLRLFERIGAGGVPLSNAERLFSIYKHHEPLVHDAVAAIEASVGRVMPATEIAGTALRIAAAQEPNNPTFGTLDVRSFAKTMAAGPSPFTIELNRLLPDPGTSALGSLAEAFRDVFKLLSYDAESNPRGLPKVMLADLPSEPIQALVYWVVLARAAGTDLSAAPALGEKIRGEMIRFALFWHLCSLNNEKGGRQSFRRLRDRSPKISKHPADATEFPGKELYNVLTGDDRSALSLVPPDAIRRYGQWDPDCKWRSWKTRFEREGFEEPTRVTAGTRDLYRTWWFSGGKMLLWLQRSYLTKEFASYDPSSDRDDERPYDLDHIQPKAAWAFDWRHREKQIEDLGNINSFGEGRHQLGDGIGNLRWIGSSENRSYGATGLVEKLRLERFDSSIPRPELDPWMDSAFDAKSDDAVALWVKAGANGRWTTARIQAFQRAVEERTTWLFQQFWDGAGFCAWFSAKDGSRD